LGGQILTLNGFVNPYSQVKWIFSTKMAQRKALILFKLNSHAKMAPDSLVPPMDRARPQGSGLDLIDSPEVTTASYQNRDIGMLWTSSGDLSDDSISTLGNGIFVARD
jgi:hypothetical protein